MKEAEEGGGREKEVNQELQEGKHNLKLKYRGENKTFHSSTFLENKKHKTIQKI